MHAQCVCVQCRTQGDRCTCTATNSDKYTKYKSRLQDSQKNLKKLRFCPIVW